MRLTTASTSTCVVVLAVACSSSPGGGGPPDAGPETGAAEDGSAPDRVTSHDAPSVPLDATDAPVVRGDTAKDVGGPSTLTPGQSTIDMTVAGQARTAVLFVPTSATSASQLAIALHGDGDTDTNFLATSGLQPLSEADGTVLIVPQGITRDVVVNFGGGMTQTVPGVDWDAYNSAASGNIDLPFLDALRDKIVATGQVDPNHVFVFGYSQGGYLAFEYGMVTSTALSCSAVLAASSPFGGAPGDPLIAGAMRKIPIVLQVGTADGAYAAAQQTESTLMSDGFPTELNAIAGAGHVPIPGDVSVPWGYCRAQAL
jgi:poly(3-hydroxybutyrate) depolymerase